MVETDVLNLIEGFSNLRNFNFELRKIFTQVTNLVATLAEKNEELVQADFLIKFMSYYVSCNQRMQMSSQSTLMKIL